MKLNLFFVAFILSICISCKAQQTQPAIKLLNGSAFTYAETVKYQVSSPQNIYYYISLEKLLDNNWREAILDLSNHAPDRAAIAQKAIAGKKYSNAYSLKNIPAVLRANGNTYRLKISYGNSAEGINKTDFSQEFHIK